MTAMMLKTCKRHFILAAAICLAPTLVHADEILIDDILKTEFARHLANTDDAQKNYFIYEYCFGVNGWIKSAACKVLGKAFTQGSADISDMGNITLIDNGDTKYSEVKPAAIPETIEKEAIVIKNCSSSKRTYNEDVTVAYEEGYSISTNQTVKTSKKTETKIEATIQVVSFSFGTGIQEDVSFSETESINKKRSVSKEISVNEEILPFTALVVEIEKKTSNAYVDFEGSVIPDGQLRNFNGQYQIRYSDYVDVKPIYLSGQIWNSTYSALSKSYLEVPLPTNLAECQETLTNSEFSKSQPHSAPTSTSYSTQSRAKLSVYEAAPATKKFYNDMIIDTRQPELLASIQVRSKSLSGALCGVTIESHTSEATQYNISGSDWSEWHNVLFYTKPESHVLSGSDTCDGNVETEIRYF